MTAAGADTHQDDLAAAVALGWRVAELYSIVDDPGECTQDTLLPAHGSLAPADQLELQLRAAAGDAKRAGVTSDDTSLTKLTIYARGTATGDCEHEAFRARLRCCHIEINKDLWSRSEALGKAYELGNGLSDTYGLVCRAYRDGKADSEKLAWQQVFDDGRIERLKKLIDDLESRLDATAVTVVREQLDAWRVEVSERLKADDVPEIEAVRKGLRRQTVIWRQLIAGDKRPEAYLGAEQRAQVRNTLRDVMWKRYRWWLPLLALVLAACVFVLPKATAWYQESVVQSGIASAVVAAIGAVGITQASVILTLRTRLHNWADLLWDHAVANEVVHATLTVGDVFSEPLPREPGAIAEATTRAAERLRACVRPRSAAQGGEAG